MGKRPSSHYYPGKNFNEHQKIKITEGKKSSEYNLDIFSRKKVL